MRNAIAVAVILTSLAVPAFANLLVNGDFSGGTAPSASYTQQHIIQNNPIGWNLYDSGWTSYKVVGGTADTSLTVVPDSGPGNSGCALDMYTHCGSIIEYQMINTIPGQSYTLSGYWECVQFYGDVWAEMQFFNSSNPKDADVAGSEFIHAGSGFDWTSFSYTTKATSSHMIVGLKAGCYLWLGDAWMRFTKLDVEMVQTPEPGGLLALGAGMVGFLGFVIRRSR